jgi:hypothetical protein
MPQVWSETVFAGITLPWPWAYPALEVLHIIGIGLLLGNLVLLELRVFGRGAALPVPELARLSLTVVAIGFSLAAASGVVMFATQPGTCWPTAHSPSRCCCYSWRVPMRPCSMRVSRLTSWTGSRGCR